MSFKQYLRAEVVAGLDETYKVDAAWAEDHPGRAYFDVHLSTINEHERATPIFRRHLPGSGLRILESGCGSGRWMAFFETLGHKAFGVDDSWGPLRLARRHDPDMRLVKANALQTPYADDTFDAVFSSYVAEHFENGPEELFREIHRVLKPNGQFLYLGLNSDAYIRFVFPPLHGHGYWHRSEMPDQWRALLTDAGFDVVGIGTQPGTLWVLGQKKG